MGDIGDILKNFETVNLEEMDALKLSNRSETKFIFSCKELPVLLENLKGYKVLSVNGCLNFSYTTHYLDTSGFDMYLAHHNGKLNRYKIRIRIYENIQKTFLEIKFKTNKDRTIKDRFKLESLTNVSNSETSAFIKTNSPYDPASLSVSLIVKYNRISLVNLEGKEKITIDTDFEFHNSKEQLKSDNLVIAEIKRSGGDKTSVLKEFKDLGIKPQSISKYCVGVGYLYPGIKNNNFKEKLTTLNKLSNDIPYHTASDF